MYDIRYSLPNGTFRWFSQKAVPRIGEFVELPDNQLFIVAEIRHRPERDDVLIHLAYT